MLNNREVIFNQLKEIICDLLDVENDEVTTDTFIIRELEAESIDLMELAIEIKKDFFKRQDSNSMSSDVIFLKNLRVDIIKFKSEDLEIKVELKKKYSHLSYERIEEILLELNKGPILKVSDVRDYIIANR